MALKDEQRLILAAFKHCNDSIYPLTARRFQDNVNDCFVFSTSTNPRAYIVVFFYGVFGIVFTIEREAKFFIVRIFLTGVVSCRLRILWLSP